MKWNGLKNGELLQLITQYNIDCWIVVDKNIPYQQNIENLPCMIIVLDVYRNTLKHLIPLVPKVITTLNQRFRKEVMVLPEK
jgi:hypothetical protein